MSKEDKKHVRAYMKSHLNAIQLLFAESDGDVFDEDEFDSPYKGLKEMCKMTGKVTEFDELFYNSIVTLYCCTSKDIAGSLSSSLGIEPEQIDRLKKSLWKSYNKSEKKYLKLHNKESYGYFQPKVYQFEFDVLDEKFFMDNSWLIVESRYKHDDEIFVPYKANSKNIFEKWGIDLEELEGIIKYSLGSQTNYWSIADLEQLSEDHKLSIERALEIKIHFKCLSKENKKIWSNNLSDESKALKFFDENYKSISKEIRESFFYEIDSGEEEINLEKLNLVAVKRCAYETLEISDNEDFLIKNSTPSKVKKKYNLSENDYVEVMDHIRSTLYEHRELDQKRANEKFKIAEDSKKKLRRKFIGSENSKETALEVEKTELKKEIEQKISLERKMKRLVAQYSHTLGNSLFPDLIYKVAEELKDHVSFRKNSLVLLRAYHAEVFVKHQAEMLRVKHGSVDGSEFRRFILGDRLQEGSDDDSVAVIDILCYAAERVVDRLLNQNYSKLKPAQAKLVKKSGMDLESLRNDFEDKVYFEKKQTVLKWINEKLAKTKIEKLSPSWEKVMLRKNGYAHALLQGHFGEIFFNAFKYANHDEKEFLTIKFKEHTDKNHTWLQMTWENPCGETDKNTNGEGMEGIVVDLKLLNQNESEKFTLNSNIINNFFQLNLNYRSDMLLTPKEDTELAENFFS